MKITLETKTKPTYYLYLDSPNDTIRLKAVNHNTDGDIFCGEVYISDEAFPILVEKMILLAKLKNIPVEQFLK